MLESRCLQLEATPTSTRSGFAMAESLWQEMAPVQIKASTMREQHGHSFTAMVIAVTDLANYWAQFKIAIVLNYVLLH
eukprot:5892656-Karenia_brevis.AAC.1